jgi:peptidoglycan hydrolase-like protein with peptidoglycan-binding domain
MSPDFSLANGAYEYRPLKKATPQLRGWDVYAVQTAVMASGFALPQFGADGFFGDETTKAVKGFQGLAGLAADGIAGIITQHGLGARLALKVEKTLGLPDKLLYGATENECGWELGNHTEPYKDGTRDLGAAQKNEPVTVATCDLWFNVLPAIRAFGKFILDRHKHYADLYALTDRRNWELAVAAWNRPAWADTLARGGKLTDTQQAWVDRYIAKATAYVVWS